MHHPDRDQGDKRIHDANQVVLDEMLHTGKSKKLFLGHYDLDRLEEVLGSGCRSND
jgi:hypothetical protein